MATSEQTITSATAYVQVVASSASTFLIENTSSSPVLIWFADSLPSGAAVGHRLDRGEAITRVGLGNVYARLSDAADARAKLVVTV